MTTKLQHSINPLTRAPHNSNINFAVADHNIPILSSDNIHRCCPDLQVCLHKVESSMDRILELQNIESMKKTMMMHEHVFKQQVQELHRLYNIQKKMMQELKKGPTRLEEKATPQTAKQNSEFPVWHQTAITQTGHNNFQVFTARDDPKELSGSCSGESSRMAIKFDLQTPPEITPSSTNHLFEEQKDLERIDEGSDDVEVELTLSIGCCTRKLQRNQSNRDEKSDSSTKKLNKDEEYVGPSSSYQENKRPHWLMQDLSLNRT